ncbi:RNA polymerase sigma factor [Aestuariivivens sp. NBU2969]|uniref:RNA polymerase sigma factor n=1 Tax=Aestuariivivens sp. NBU2969 TaxID=2873267 RepID=UPI001CBC0B25|nr:RNA polymerase sigma-70 factor [Aestuariivivens sp. NBU2969]
MKNSEENIELLVQNFKNGSTLAFKILFEKYHVELTAFINSYTNDEALSKDIVQESFVKLWDARANIKSENSISAYLYKIGYYIFIDNYRKNKKESEMIDSLTYKALSSFEETDTIYLKEQRLKKIYSAIENLPPRCKEIFKMSKLQGYKYYEIAKMLKITEKAVESQMSIAFKKIRSEINNNNSLLLFFNLMAYKFDLKTGIKRSID